MILTIQIEMNEESQIQTSTDAGRVLAVLLGDILNRDHQDMSQYVGEVNRIRDIGGDHVGFWNVSQ